MRFPEFSGEWDEYAIGEILSIGNGRDYKHLHNGDIPVFGTGGYMTSVDDFLYDGESVFVGRKGTINKPLYYNGKFWTVDTLFYTYNFTDVLPKFVYCLFQTINWLKYNEASGVPSLSKATIEKIKVRIPSMDEQDKLSNLLFLLDKRIEVQNKIIEDLKKLKSAIYQEMFGGLVAQTLKLGQVAEVVKGKQVNGTELLEQGDYYVMNGGTLPSGWLYKYNTEANTISISEGGNSCGYVQYNTSPYWSGGHCYSLKILHPQETSDLYLYHFLKWQEENIMALRIGSGLPNIQKKDLLHFPVILPTITQQNKIVLILSAIEEKVSCEISITQYFVKQKEYLLSQLFI